MSPDTGSNFATDIASVVDMGGKFATGVLDIGGKFDAGGVDIRGNFAAGVVYTGGAP
jgi:hypothetical protein